MTLTLEARNERRRWQKKRRLVREQDMVDNTGNAMYLRIDMRMEAQWYAAARGWNVALTPPQRRREGSKRG